MNYSSEDLEIELKAMVPLETSRALETRISMELDKADDFKRKSGVILFWQPFAMAMAASIALVAAIIYTMPESVADDSPSNVTRIGNNQLFGSQSTELANNFEAVGATQQLTNAFDEGIVYNDDEQMLRQFRYQFVDTVTMKNAINGSLYSMAVPREEVILVPVAIF